MYKGKKLCLHNCTGHYELWSSVLWFFLSLISQLLQENIKTLTALYWGKKLCLHNCTRHYELCSSVFYTYICACYQFNIYFKFWKEKPSRSLSFKTDSIEKNNTRNILIPVTMLQHFEPLYPHACFDCVTSHFFVL